jgi:hypothetical protein
MRGPEPREPGAISSRERRRVLRAAALRPLNVLMLVIGAGIFATTLAWWMVPLTLGTYTALVYLSARDPVFGRRVLRGGEEATRLSAAGGDGDVSPERRARWLPRGEVREKVEAALVVYRKVVAAIEESDDVTRAVLDDAVPKLHAAANRLVDVAQGRERAAEVIRESRQHTGPGSDARAEDLRGLEDTLRAADAEISDTLEKMLTLRARVVRVSVEGGPSAQATAFNASLDELNARLEALGETMSPPGAPRGGAEGTSP